MWWEGLEQQSSRAWGSGSCVKTAWPSKVGISIWQRWPEVKGDTLRSVIFVSAHDFTFEGEESLRRTLGKEVCHCHPRGFRWRAQSNPTVRARTAVTNCWWRGHASQQPHCSEVHGLTEQRSAAAVLNKWLSWKELGFFTALPACNWDFCFPSQLKLFASLLHGYYELPQLFMWLKCSDTA